MKTYQCWVKKLVSRAQWVSWYSKQSSYCKFKEDANYVLVGFLVANECPKDCELMNDYELRQVDKYRRMNNVAPFPLEEIKVEKEKVSEATLNELNKIRANLFGKTKRGEAQELEEKPTVRKSRTVEPLYTPEEEEKRKKFLGEIPF
jgi:hypothetical protein